MEKEKEQFSQVFSKVNCLKICPHFRSLPLSLEKNSLLNILSATDQFESKGEIRRLVKQGAIKIDNNRVEDPDTEIKVEKSSENLIIKAGKKIFIKIVS